MPMNRRQKPYKFRIAGTVHTFYGETKREATDNAKAWAKRHRATATSVR